MENILKRGKKHKITSDMNKTLNEHRGTSLILIPTRHITTTKFACRLRYIKLVCG